MTFFNKKEEVLDIELTAHGKEQLAKGELKPAYYAFFDDGILYDSEYAGFTENQNNVESRIQESTVSLHSQANYETVDANRSFREFQTTSTKHYALASSLGTSTISNEYFPAWNIKVLVGEVTSSVGYSTGSHQTLAIPQLDIDVTYTTIVRHVDDGNDRNITNGFLGDRAVLTSRIFEDGTYIEILQDKVLLDIFEENTEFELENIDVEFYEVESSDVSGSIRSPGIASSQVTKREILNPLKFQRKFSNVKNNLLVPNLAASTSNIEVDSNYVEHYLDILADHEIPKNIICSAISGMRSKGVDIDTSQMDLDCLDPTDPSLERPFNIYATNISEDTDPGCED